MVVHVMKKFLFLVSMGCGATLFCISASAQNYSFLNPMFSFGPHGDGSIRPGDRPYITTGSFQRGLSYNPFTGNIILIDRAAGGGGSPNISGGIYVLNGLDGSDIGTLSTNGMGGGNFADFCVAIADDGFVYVGNLVNDGTASNFKLYRWDSDTSLADPVVVFNGDPGNGKPQRWGDTMDIRGAGTTTQIILGSRTSGNVIGTNVAILTTTDGVSFTARTLSTDVSDAAFGGGIAFGTGDTFWAKNLDTPLRQFGFDLTAGTATTLHNYGPDVLAGSQNLEPLAFDPANNLLAIVDMTSAVDHVRLYDIANPANPPVLLDIRDFPVDNANGTTTKGYLDFGFERLYVHNMNNGLMGFSIDVSPVGPPTIARQPASQRALAGRTVYLDVVAYPAATYQWQRNDVNIPGATGAVLSITNVQTANAGTYKVIVTNPGGTVTSSDAVLSVVNPEDLVHLNPLWSATPGIASYVTSTGGAGTPSERSFAYNAPSNQVLVVQRSGNNYTIHVIDASTGTKLYNLKTNGIVLVVGSEVAGANGIGLVAIDVADDGAVYACNASPNASGGTSAPNTNKLFRVYRWANSESNTLPVQIFEGDPAAQTSNFRWGDALDARGSGPNTQILLDNQNSTARFMAILQPTDSTMSVFASVSFFQDTTTQFGASIGRSLEFGSGDIIWQKRRSAPLIQSSFDVNAFPNISPVVSTHTNFASTVGAVGLDLSRNLLAGINFVGTATEADKLSLYDISDRDNPLVLAQYNFPQNPRVANNNSIGRVLFAGNRVFALNGNNGMMAFTIASGPVTPPTILRHPQNVRVVAGSAATLSVVTADIVTYQWQFNGVDIADATASTYTITNAQASGGGTYRVIVSNEAGSTTSSNAMITVLPAEDFHRLERLWDLAPVSRPYLLTDTDGQGRTPLYRGIAYNAFSNQVYVIGRASQTSGLTINVLDASTGADLYQLNIDGIVVAPTIVLLAVDVAEDGSLYAANMTDTPAQPYRLYRWVNSDSNTLPMLVYSGDPGVPNLAGLRWGDTMDVRGAGTNTEIIVDANTGSAAALFKATSEAMDSFVPTPFSQTYGSGSIGRSLEFGAGDTFWQKRHASRLQLSSYDLAAPSSTPVTNYANFPNTLGPVSLDLSRNVLAGLNFSGQPEASANVPDTLDLYDISDLSNPLIIAKYPFPTNKRPNGNAIGQVIFAGNRVFAVDGNNGIVAFTIMPPGGQAPTLTITRSGSAVVLSWPAPSTGFVLQKTANLSAPDWQNVQTQVIPANGQNTVTESHSGSGAFYRLQKP